MPLAIDVRHSLKRLEKSLNQYAAEQMAAHVRASNRAMTTVRKEGATEMRAVLPGLKVGTIKRQMKQDRATRLSPAAVLTFTANRFRLFAGFGARQTASGVRISGAPWRIETADGQTVSPAQLSQAFIQRSRASGSPFVFLRAGAARYPITSLLAPSLATAFAERGIGAGLVRIGRARYAVVLEQERKFRLSKGI